MNTYADAAEVLEAMDAQTKERSMNVVAERAPSMPATQSRHLATAATPADLLRIALESGADLDRLEKLMAMQERWEANQARKAFVEAMAEFKKDPPEIFKRTLVDFETAKGRTTYMHASIGDVTSAVIESLARVGISHRWKPSQADGMIAVECILTHSMGHSESTTLEAAPDLSGGKNNIQAMISTKTYLERHTLLAACGLATKDMPDDDGAGGPPDTSLRDEWVANANKALTLEVLNQTWNLGVAAINEAGDKPAYDAFKAAVAAKKQELMS